MVLFADAEHVEVEATLGIHQRLLAAYRDPDRTGTPAVMNTLIEPPSQGVPAASGRAAQAWADPYIARSLLETGG